MFIKPIFFSYFSTNFRQTTGLTAWPDFFFFFIPCYSIINVRCVFTGWEHNTVLECSCWLFDKGCLFLHLFFKVLTDFILKLWKINKNTNIQRARESFDSPEKVSETSHIRLPLEIPTACGIQCINRVCLANCLFLLLQAKSESGSPLL